MNLKFKIRETIIVTLSSSKGMAFFAKCFEKACHELDEGLSMTFEYGKNYEIL